MITKGNHVDILFRIVLVLKNHSSTRRSLSILLAPSTRPKLLPVK